MKSRPLLLKGPLVRRSLDGRKTETRRLITRVSGIGPVTEFQPSSTPGYDWIMRDRGLAWNDLTTAKLLAGCPYGGPGDQFWVRETFRATTAQDGLRGYVCRADGSFASAGYTADVIATWERLPGGWRPSIFMPREACRLVLLIRDVRIERLQDITDEDVQAEGVADLTMDELLELGAAYRRLVNGVLAAGERLNAFEGTDDLIARFLRTAPLRERFRLGWNLINGHRPGCSWEDNPWVWVIRYRSHDEP